MTKKTLRDGRYVIESALGEGGQGTTYIAVDTKAQRRVAVKRFRVGKAKKWKDVELAEREAKTLAVLDHHRLPHYVEHFEEGDSLVLVMELIEGASLAQLRKEGKTASIADIEHLLDDAQAALDYLHSRAPAVIHRDIKPANVIRKNDGSYAFVDFGSVRDRLKPAGGSTVVGTFGYMAPEQFQGRAGPATDVFGVGATVIAYLTGTEPEELPHKGLAIDVRAAVPKTTPAWLVNALERMLEPDPDQRAQSIADALIEGNRKGRSEPPRKNRDDPTRDARRRERKERRAERKALRRSRPRRPVPFLPRIFAHLGVSIAQLAVLIALGIVFPFVLVVLSVVFGPGLRRAAAACRRASTTARTAMDGAHARLDGAGDAAEGDGEDEDDEQDSETRARIADDVLKQVRAVTPSQAQELAMRERERVQVRKTTDDPEEWAAEKATLEARKWAADERGTIEEWEARQRAWEEAEEERARAAEEELARKRRNLP